MFEDALLKRSVSRHRIRVACANVRGGVIVAHGSADYPIKARFAACDLGMD